MTREEMIKLAVETRKQVTSAIVTKEQFDRYPIQIRKEYIPTRSGASEVYISSLEEAGDEALIINFHGGGFIKKRTENDDYFCRKLVHRLKCKTLDVDYRVAPEHPFPTGFYECYDVVRWAFENTEKLGVDRNKIILSGHSAGGNFVAGICMLLEEEKGPKPLGVIIDYPPMDLFSDPDSKEKRGKGIPAERARLYNLYYCEKADQKNPFASPVFAAAKQLKNFPPALFITAGADDLCNECEEFALKVARAGGLVTIKRFAGAGHGFTIYRLPGYEEATELIIRFAGELLCGVDSGRE